MITSEKDKASTLDLKDSCAALCCNNNAHTVDCYCNKKHLASMCCFWCFEEKNPYIREFNYEYCSAYPDGFCHSKWKSYIPYLLISPNNDSWFLDFQEELCKKDKDLFLKYKYALLEYLTLRDIDLWKKAYYLDEKPNFKKLCEFFCSKEERDFRREENCCIPF